jgi:hypothetical protein
MDDTNGQETKGLPEVQARELGSTPATKEGGEMMYVYKKSTFPGERLWTVGFYDPSGRWHPESDHDSEQSAAERVHYLNGGREEQHG